MTRQALEDLREQILRVDRLERDLRSARAKLATRAQRCHGLAHVRDVARRTGLSGATVSNFFRGHICVNMTNALRVVNAAADQEEG